VIFKTLAVMIHDQGDIVDSIEANIDSTQTKIKNANSKLKEAVKYKVNLMSRNNNKKRKTNNLLSITNLFF
jgi:t-SNARE complex subunit (syntaxin)